MSKIKCPLMQEEIEDDVCFDIHMKVEGLAPDWTVPKKVLSTPDYQKICTSCPNHRED